jgi:hypothetical protein
MTLRPILIAAAALAPLALAACNLNSNNNTAPADNSAPPITTNAAPADNSASNDATNAISNAARHPMLGGGDNQH